MNKNDRDSTRPPPGEFCSPESLDRLKQEGPSAMAACGQVKMEPLPLKANDQVGEYRLIEVIGKGGMGVVWKAQERFPDRIVALKVIHPKYLSDRFGERREEAVKRFRLEVATAARLEHDNIVPVYHAGEASGYLFYTMQYIEGMNPAEAVAALRSTISPADVETEPWPPIPRGTGGTGQATLRRPKDAARVAIFALVRSTGSAFGPRPSTGSRRLAAWPTHTTTVTSTGTSSLTTSLSIGPIVRG